MFKDDEKKIIEALKDKDNGSDSMRVVGRGTLVMSAQAVRESEAYKNLLKNVDIVNRTKSK